MEKILELISSLVSDVKNKNEKILELERKLDSYLLEIEDKNKKINELEAENIQLKLEKVNEPLKPSPSSPYVPNTPLVPNQPSLPDWPYWPPYGPIITYVSTDDIIY